MQRQSRRATVRAVRVTFRPEAVRDLTDIFHFVLELSQSAIVARGFVSRIRRRCVDIGNVPFGGRPRDDLEPGLRTIAFERSAVIAYKIEDDSVRITNIFYGGRNFEALYREGIDPLDPPQDG